MNDPLIFKVLLQDNPDGSYSIGQVVDAIGEYYVVRYELSYRDPPPLKWSDLRYVFDIKEDCNDKEAIQA